VFLCLFEIVTDSLISLSFLLFLVFAIAEYDIGKTASALSEELLFIFPVISLMSSPSKCVKGAATDLLVTLEKLLVKMSVALKNEQAMEGGFPSLSTPGSVAFRLLQHLWFQVTFHYLISGSFLCLK
jgi:hypothetical protein